MASAGPAPHAQPNGQVFVGPTSVSNSQGLDPLLLDVLACPADHHAPLRLGSPDDPQSANLTCTECGRVFPIRDGIPVLLLDEATSGGDGADGSLDGR